MIAALPPWLRDLIDAWPLILTLAGGIGWIGRRQRAWTKRNISDPIEAIRTESAATRHLVSYHLGPNGETKPLHRRVADIEQANGIDAPPWEEPT